MKSLIAIIFSISLSALAAAPPRGADQLRSLVVFPELSLGFNMGIGLEGNEVVIGENDDDSFEISELREKLKLRPDNCKTLLRLGYLLDNNYDTNGSQVCYERVAKLCREKVAANPEDTLALDDLGDALSGLGRDAEAETTYRKATATAPKDWRCWVNLGNFLPWNSFLSMFPENMRNQVGLGMQPSQVVLGYRPSPASLQKAQGALMEASQCFDKAIVIAPEEPDVYLQRAGYMMISNWANCFFSYYGGEQKPDSLNWASPQFSVQTVANLRKAAELSPKNPDYAGLAACFEWWGCAMRAKSANMTPEMLPETSRQSIDNGIARLENMSQSPNEHVAAAALEYLGVLNFVLGNPQMAAPQLRRAVALDPMRPQSWDVLLAAVVMKNADFPDEAVAICNSRLKYNNSGRNHLLLAKAYTHKNEWKNAAAEAEIAAGLDTNNVIAPIMLVAIDLKQSENADFILKASDQLDRASALVGRMSSGTESWKRWREINLDNAIYNALLGTPDAEKTARQCLDQVLKYYPNDQTAKAILDALPGESPSSEVQGN